MHAMLGDVTLPHRLEGSGSDVQRDIGDIDTLLAQLSQQRLIKMQTCRRRRYRAFFARIHSLIAFFIRRLCRAVDIRRQRQAAVTLDQVSGVSGKTQPVELAVTPQHLYVERAF